jgi:hypothetical protein
VATAAHPSLDEETVAAHADDGLWGRSRDFDWGD